MPLEIKPILRAAIAGLVILVLMGCTPPTAGPTPQAGTLTPDQAIQPSTPSPTSTPESMPPVVLLHRMSGMDPALDESLQNKLGELAAKAQMELVVSDSLRSEKLEKGSVVIAAAFTPGLVEVIQAAPEAQFIALGDGNLPSAQNLSRVLVPLDEQAFLSGYIAALATYEYRVGMLSRENTPDGQKRREAFLNGAWYLCGVCTPKYPPYVSYPVFAGVTPDGTGAISIEAIQAALDELKAQGVTTVFADPELASDEMNEAVGQMGMQLVSAVPAPSDYEGPGDLLVARVTYDLAAAIEELWPRVLVGQGGGSVTAPLQVTENNGNFLPNARLRLVEETRDGLAEGWISPLGD